VAPPALKLAQQAQLKAAVQRPPREAGIALADWNWQVVRRYVAERFGITLQRSSCHQYLHRLGFVLKRPNKRSARTSIPSSPGSPPAPRR
jgi:transposase